MQQELSMARHPNILQFRSVFVTERHLALCHEYIEGETIEVRGGRKGRKKQGKG